MTQKSKIYFGMAYDPKVRARGWTFTINNWTEKDYTEATEWKTAYTIFGKENCPTTGTPHLQGYLYFINAKTWKSVCELNPKGHWEPAVCYAKINEKYCKKEHEYFVKGEPPKQGARIDLQLDINSILEGEKKADDFLIEDAFKYHQYGRTMLRAEAICMRSKFRTTMPENIWYYGETGKGKSHRAFNNFHPDTHHVWEDDGEWQDDYRQQPTIIINEFRGNTMSYKQLLKITDKWPNGIARRYVGKTPNTSEKIIVTSALPPWKIFTNLDKDDKLDQLFRRFKIFKCIDEDTEELVNPYQKKESKWTRIRF